MRLRPVLLVPLLVAAVGTARADKKGAPDAPPAGSKGDPAAAKADAKPDDKADTKGDKADAKDAKPDASSSTGDAGGGDGKGGPPNEVAVGIYLVQILSTDLKTNSFVASFWVWFRWKGDNMKPLETFEIVGGKIESKDGQTTEDLEGGVHYGAVRVQATITKFFDVSQFPLDNQLLTIAIEDSDHDDRVLKYVVDKENCAMDPGVAVPGWAVGKLQAVGGGHTYATNYGDTSLPSGSGSTYSRFEFRIPLLRQGFGYFLKLFWGGYLAVLIGLLALFIKPTDLDPRFGLGVGAVFAAMASAYVISSALPDTQVMTLADKVNALGISFIFLSVVESTISLRLFTAGHEKASKRLDQYSFYGLLVLFAVLNVIFVATR